MSIHDLYRRQATPSIAKANLANIGLYLDHNLPEVHPPGRERILIFGVDGANIYNFHRLFSQTSQFQIVTGLTL
jgi:hypothetical protein